MEDIINRYRKLLSLLNEEQENISKCLEGELLELYTKRVAKEAEAVEKELRKIYNKT